MSNVGRQKDYFRNNAHEVVLDISYIPPGSSEPEPWSGALNVEIRATRTGAAMTGLGPFALAESPAGTYRRTFSAAAMLAGLAGAGVADDAIVYQVTTSPIGVEIVQPLCVRATRYAT